jgi:hypothetical protein
VGGFTARMQPLTLPGREESNKTEPQDSDGGRKNRQAGGQAGRRVARHLAVFSGRAWLSERL